MGTALSSKYVKSKLVPKTKAAGQTITKSASQTKTRTDKARTKVAPHAAATLPGARSKKRPSTRAAQGMLQKARRKGR